MKPPQNHRYYIQPSSQANESVMNMLRQTSVTVVQETLRCSDGKERDLIEVTRDTLILLRSEKDRSGLGYTAFRQIGEGRPAQFDERSFERTAEKTARTKCGGVKPGGKSDALAKLRAVPGVRLGSEISPTTRA